MKKKGNLKYEKTFYYCCSRGHAGRLFDNNGKIQHEMPPVTPQYKEMQHFFVAGIAQEKIVEPNEICMITGVNTIKKYYSFVDGVAAVFTGGIWTPNTIEVYCNRPKK